MRALSALLAAALLAALVAGCIQVKVNGVQPPAAVATTSDDPRRPHDAQGQPVQPRPSSGPGASTSRSPTSASGPTPTISESAGPEPAPIDFPLFAAPVRMNHTYGAARETSLAVGADGLRFACDPSGVPALNDGHSYFYLSSDGGAQWRDLDAESTSTDTRRAAFEGGDCDVALGPAGELWTADTWLGSLSVGVSADGGASWRGTALGGTSPGVDRPWLAIDAAGTAHLTYQDVQFAMPSAIWYSHALAGEGPLAFTPATLVAGADAQGTGTWTGNLVVSDDGSHLWSVYTRRLAPLTSGPESVWVARSTDGGLTWASSKVSDRPESASYLYPSLARDGTGVLHVVFAQQTDHAHPVFHSWSSDDGATWREPEVVRDGVSAFSPWVAGAKGGGAAIQWFGSPTPSVDFNDNRTQWFAYWATATPEGKGYRHLSGTTTLDPLYVGKVVETPEFNMVRLGADGAMQLGLSIPVYDKRSDSSPWSAFYQAQVAGPVFG